MSTPGTPIFNADAIYEQYRHKLRASLQQLQTIQRLGDLRLVQEAIHGLAVVSYTLVLFNADGTPTLQAERWIELTQMLDQAHTRLAALLNNRTTLRDEPVIAKEVPCWTAALATAAITDATLAEVETLVRASMGARVSSAHEGGTRYYLFREYEDAADTVALCYQNIAGLPGTAIHLFYGPFSDHVTSVGPDPKPLG